MKPSKFGFSTIAGLTILLATTAPAAAEDLHTVVQQQKANVQTIQNEIELLQESISKLSADIEKNYQYLDATKAKIEKIQSEIEEKEAKIAELEKDIEERVEILKERATSLQLQDHSDIVLDVILHSENIADLMKRASSLYTIFQSDADIMEQLENDQATVEAEKEAVIKQKETVLEKQKELEAQQTALTENEAQKKESLATLTEKLTVAATKLDATEAQLKEQEAAALFIAEQNEEPTPTSRKKTRTSIVSNESNSSGRSNSTSNNSSNPNNSSENSNSHVDNSSSSNSNNLIDIALSYQGVPYVFGGKSPSGFDCSGFIWYAFNQSGHNIGYQTAAGYYSSSTKVSDSNLQIGDVVFFSNTYKPGVSHAGIYIGNNQMVHAGSSGITITSLSNSYWASHFTGFGRL